MLFRFGKKGNKEAAGGFQAFQKEKEGKQHEQRLRDRIVYLE